MCQLCTVEKSGATIYKLFISEAPGRSSSPALSLLFPFFWPYNVLIRGHPPFRAAYGCIATYQSLASSRYGSRSHAFM